MVYFTCNYCGESLKKAQVEIHLTHSRCSGGSVSCMDCQRDFDVASSSHHIKCISEAEKYSGGNYAPKLSTMNSEKKRSEWMDLVVRVANDKKGRTKSEQKLLDFLANMQSVPAKEKAFMNFIENGVHNLRPAAKSVWALIQNEKELSMKSQPQQNTNLPTNVKEKSSSKDEGETAKPSKKSKVVVEEAEEQVVSKKDKKKKSKQNGHQEQNDNVEETAAESKKDKKKKSKQNGHQEHNDDVEETATGSKKDKKKKKKAKENGDSMIEAEQPIVEFESKKEKRKKKKQARENGYGEENGDMETEEVSKKKSKKRKLVEEEQPLEYDKKCRLNETLEAEEPVIAKGKFPWREVIVQVLENSKKKSMSMKKLRRKVMSEYQTRGGDPTDKGLSVEKVETKLNKALKKLPNVLIQQETVQLVENDG